MPACALLWLTVAAAAQPPAHAIEFWRSIAQHDYVLPSGSDLPALTAELEEYLASPDPERRDEIAYSTLAAWIYGKRLIGTDLLRPLTDRLVANLKQGIVSATPTPFSSAPSPRLCSPSSPHATTPRRT